MSLNISWSDNCIDSAFKLLKSMSMKIFVHKQLSDKQTKHSSPLAPPPFPSLWELSMCVWSQYFITWHNRTQTGMKMKYTINELFNLFWIIFYWPGVYSVGCLQVICKLWDKDFCLQINIAKLFTHFHLNACKNKENITIHCIYCLTIDSWMQAELQRTTEKKKTTKSEIRFIELSKSCAFAPSYQSLTRPIWNTIVSLKPNIN